MRRALSAFVYVLTLLLATFVVSEALVRVLHPAPRRLVYRSGDGRQVVDILGVPAWAEGGHGPGSRRWTLEGRDCDDAHAFRVLVVGDSISHGIEIAAPDVASVRLAEALRAQTGAPVCVRNVSMPGFSLYQSMAAARAELPTFVPDVVLLELWGGPPRVPVQVGATIYQIEGDPARVWAALNPLGLPDAAARFLLGRSRFYEYAVLSLDHPDGSGVPSLAPHLPLLDDFVDTFEARGAEVITWMPAFLDRPFTAQPDALFESNADLETWTTRRGLVTLRTWEVWKDQDSAPFGFDGCHLTELGHARLTTLWADALTPHVRAWQAARAPEPTSTEPPALSPPSATP